jgi:hypothetical protein
MNRRMSGDGSHKRIDQRTQRELAALADGCLASEARSSLEARMADSPELRVALERQRLAVAALRGLDVEAPARLRRAVAAERPFPRGPRRRRGLALGGGLAGAVAAIALALVLMLGSGGGAPTVAETAQLSYLPATRTSVPVDARNPKLLVASQDGVPFPNLHADFAWRQAGERTDELAGRSTRTVYYTRDGKRIGYTILAGEAIGPPPGARQKVQNGVRLSTVTEDGQAIVTWLRGGRTCVLSGKGVSAKDLREVASWKGDGGVPF